MRGIFLLAAAIGTLYVAGIYHAPAGLFAGSVELALFLFLSVSIYFLRRKIYGVVLPDQNGMQREQALPCRLKVSNRGRWPVWLWDARVLWKQDGRKNRRKLSGQVEARGEARAEFEISAPHCGFVELRLQRLRVWDPLRLFHIRVRFKGGKPVLRIPVFPPKNVLRVESARGETLQDFGSDQEPAPSVGNDVWEVQQYREYQAGDSVKNIHWKLSARSEELWVKEYSRGDAHRIGLFLDLAQRKPLDADGKDAFYEIFLALLMGLAEKYDSVYLHWFDWKEKRWEVRRIAEAEQYREILPRLYEAGFIPADQIDEKTYREERIVRVGTAMLQFDSELRLSFGGAEELVLKQFSLQSYRHEIAEQKVVIP